MKKIYLCLMAALVCTGAVQAQVVTSTSFENWTGQSPDGWKGSKTNLANDSIVEVTTGSIYGSKSVRLINSNSSHRRFTSQPIAVTDGQAYEVKFWAKGNGQVRTGLFDNSNISTTSGYHYGPYITVNTTTWTEYSQIILADTTFGSAEFILSIRSTAAASGHLQFDSLVISTPSIPEVSIYDIQFTSDPSGDSPHVGETVSTSGVVTATHSSGYFIQDGTGAWNGIYVFDNFNEPALGDSVKITASVVEYFNMTQLATVSGFSVEASGRPIPDAVVISTNAVNSEQYEGVLVKVQNATCNSTSAGVGMWAVNDGSGQCKIHNLIYQHTPTLNTVYNVTGPVYYSFSEYRIEPRSAADVESSSSVNEKELLPLSVYPNPAADRITLSLPAEQLRNGYTLKIMDLSGRVWLNRTVYSTVEQIELQGLAEGIYLLEAGQEQHRSVQRIVVTR